ADRRLCGFKLPACCEIRSAELGKCLVSSHYFGHGHSPVLKNDVLVHVRNFTCAEVSNVGEICPCEIPFILFRFNFNRTAGEGNVFEEIILVLANLHFMECARRYVCLLKRVASRSVADGPGLLPSVCRISSTDAGSHLHSVYFVLRCVLFNRCDCSTCDVSTSIINVGK